MEKSIKLKTSDGHLIYGTLSEAAKPIGLVVFVHGLTGHQNEHIFYNAAKTFAKKGLSTFRFDLYSGENGGRTLSNCTIMTHAADLDTVLKHFGRKYKTLHVVGHSLGGSTIVFADTSRVRSITLWDPSDLVGLGEMTKQVEKKRRTGNDKYIFNWGTEYIIGKSMAEEFKSLRPAELMKSIHVPTKVVQAQNGGKEGSKVYFKNANSPKEMVVIKNAGHTFDEEGVEDKLHLETLKWIKKWSALNR